MNKKIIGIAVAVIAIAAVTTVSIVTILNNNDSPSNNTSSTGSPDAVIESSVDDFKDNMNTETVSGILASCEKLNEKYSLSEHGYNNASNFDEGWRIVKGTNIDGEGESDLEKFRCSISNGINESPDFSLSFTTASLTQDEVESIAYEVIEKLSNKEMLSLIKDLEYNDFDIAGINESYLDNVSFTKTKQSSDYIDFDVENPENIESTETIELNTYIFGIKYNATSDKLEESYTQEEYDKSIYMGIPIFRDSHASDINDKVLLMPWILAQDVTDIKLTSYGYTSGLHEDTCIMGLTSVASSGEQLNTNISISLKNGTNEINYTFDTMTGYKETPEDALDAAIYLINSITGMETTKDQYEALTEPNANKDQSFMYMDIPETEEEIESADFESTLITVDVKYEPELGYYAYITAF